MKYRKPQDVISPQDVVSNIRVLFDGGPDSVSIAKINWDGFDVIGIRWNVAMREWNDPQKANLKKECLGMPVSRGYPTWFILPDDLFNQDSDLAAILKTIKDS